MNTTARDQVAEHAAALRGLVVLVVCVLAAVAWGGVQISLWMAGR